MGIDCYVLPTRHAKHQCEDRKGEHHANQNVSLGPNLASWAKKRIEFELHRNLPSFVVFALITNTALLLHECRVHVIGVALVVERRRHQTFVISQHLSMPNGGRFGEEHDIILVLAHIEVDRTVSNLHIVVNVRPLLHLNHVFT